MSLNKSSLDQVFCELILSRERYALQAFSGNLLCSEINKTDAVFRKAHRWGLTSKLYNFAEIAAECDKCLVSRILKDTHCLRPLVPMRKTNDRYQLRNNNINYVRSILLLNTINTLTHSFQEILNRYFFSTFINIVILKNYSFYIFNIFIYKGRSFSIFFSCAFCCFF